VTSSVASGVRQGSLSRNEKAGVIAFLANALKKNSYSIYDMQNRR